MIKHKNIFLWILALLPLVLVLVMYPSMPEQIPAHYGISGEVDRFGSKIELFIMPVVIFGFKIFFDALNNALNKRKNTPEQAAQNEKVVVITNYVVMFIFNAITLMIVYGAYKSVENIYTADFDIMRVTSIIISISLVILGNVFPKCKQNSTIGIRTKWTLNDEDVWYKTHRLGGALFVVFGIIAVFMCLTTFKNVLALCFTVGGFLIITAYLVYYSYAEYKK